VSKSKSESESASGIPSSVGGSAAVTANIVGFCDANIEFCASRFHSYSLDILRSLDRRTLHSLLRSRSLQIKTEDDLLRSLVRLGSKYFEFLSYVEISLLTSDCVSLFVKTLPFDELTFDIWSKIVQRLTHVRDEKLHIRRYVQYQFPIESVILKTIPKIINEFHMDEWKLLYRNSVDGLGTQTFHSKCDNHTNTITIILTTDGFVFGGFTPIA
jgi:hypothetical protein